MIRPAMPSDCTRIFHLVCCARGAQRPYRAFERSFEDRLSSSGELCLVSEEEGRLTGFIALRAGRVDDAEGKTTVSDLVVSPERRGMSTFLIVQAGRLAHAMGFDPLASQPSYPTASTTSLALTA